MNNLKKISFLNYSSIIIINDIKNLFYLTFNNTLQKQQLLLIINLKYYSSINQSLVQTKSQIFQVKINQSRKLQFMNHLIFYQLNINISFETILKKLNFLLNWIYLVLYINIHLRKINAKTIIVLFLLKRIVITFYLKWSGIKN